MRRLAALGAALLVPGALACGVCVEDKVAATYDHGIVSRAIGAGHVVVFAEPKVNAEPGKVATRLAAAASRVRGVDAGSVRTSTAPPSLSFALDPAIATPSDALARIARSSGIAGVELVSLRVMR